MATSDLRNYLMSVKDEAMKLYRVYDGTGRVTFQYETAYNTLDGENCLRTQYTYDGTSFRVIQMQETLQPWSASWEIT